MGNCCERRNTTVAKPMPPAQNPQVQIVRQQEEPLQQIPKKVDSPKPKEEPIVEPEQPKPFALKTFLPENRNPNLPAQDILDITSVFKASKIHDTVPESVDQADRERFWALNIVRAYPLFAAELLEDLQQFYQGNILKYEGVSVQTKEGAEACKSAIETCKNAKPSKPFIWNNEIYQACKDHAQDSVQNNLFGHVGSNKKNYQFRMDKYSDNPFNTGENCTYGKFTPFGLALNILIDDGNKTKGNRENLLSSKYRMGALNYMLGHPALKAIGVINYSTYSQPKDQSDIKKKIQDDLNAQVQPQIDECLKKYKGGGWQQKYDFGFPAVLHVEFEGSGGQKENFEVTLDTEALLYPNIVLFDP